MEVTSPSVKTIWYVMFHYIYVSSAVFVQLYEYRLLAAWRLCQQCSIETRDSVHKEMLSGCILFAIM